MIRQAISEDWQRIREICCLTGNAGDAIEEKRWPFFGEYWIGPYQKIIPDWTYVTEEDGKIVGYLTACPCTKTFQWRKFFLFTLPLLLKVVSGHYAKTIDSRRFLRRSLRLEVSPEQRFSLSTRHQINRKYPAHLHINLDASTRGNGIGKRMIEQFMQDLSSQDIQGIHVFCGAKPVPFYQRVGFVELERVEVKTGVWVYAMGKSMDY